MKITIVCAGKLKEKYLKDAVAEYSKRLGAFCKFKRWFFGSLHEDKFISTTHIAVFRNIVNAETGELLH